jgi:hypothetical protein
MYMLYEVLNNNKLYFMWCILYPVWFKWRHNGSETFPVYDGCSNLLVILLCHPACLESRQRWQNRSSNPNWIFSLLRWNHFHLHCRRHYFYQLLCKSLAQPREHGRSSTQYNIFIETFSDIEVSEHNWVVHHFWVTMNFLANHHGIKEGLRASEFLTADVDSSSVG